MTVRRYLSEINSYLANAHRELGMLAETCESMVAETDRLRAERDEALGRAARLSAELDAARREPRSQTTSEQIEERTESVQVREGRWRTRGGEIKNVTPTPAGHHMRSIFPWWDAATRHTWQRDGRYGYFRGSTFDLIEYLEPIELESQPEPQPEPTTSDQTAKVEEQVGSEPGKVQVREGRWLTRGGEVRNVTRTPDENELQEQFPWWDANTRNTWREDGRYVRERENVRDLVQYLGPIESRSKSQSGPWGVLRRLWLRKLARLCLQRLAG